MSRPKHRITNAQLLADLRRVARLLELLSLSASLYDQHGQFTSRTFIARFGSWTASVQRVNLEPARWRRISKESLLVDIRRVARQLKTRRLRASDYRTHGKYHQKIIFRFFDRWQSAVDAAGLSPVFYRAHNRTELFENLRRICKKLGRTPRCAEIKPPLSKFSFKAYRRYFGGLTRAMQLMKQSSKPADRKRNDLPFRPKRRTSPIINMRQRYETLRRDRYKCVLCGKSPATHADVQLQVRHINPWPRGGETVAENLRTVCEACTTRE